VPGYESWWDVPVAEVAKLDTVKTARESYAQAVKKEQDYL
jgi:3D-(3,5/4)-trihydroxycyclohexane-1,2-dione acylhydrolase (decyclizing)